MSEMMRMDAFSDDLLEGQEKVVAPEPESEKPKKSYDFTDSQDSSYEWVCCERESYEEFCQMPSSKLPVRLNSGTGKKFAQAMQKACDEKINVCITVKLKCYTSDYESCGWIAICDAFAKEAFGMDLDTFVQFRSKRSTTGLQMLYEEILGIHTVECCKVGDTDVVFRITFFGKELNHHYYYKHLLYFQENIKNLKQSTDGLQGKELVLGVAKWLRERIQYYSSDSSDKCALIFADLLYDKAASCDYTTLTVAYCEYAHIVGLSHTIPVDKLPIEISSSNVTNCIIIGQTVYFLDIACGSDNEPRLWTAEEFGVKPEDLGVLLDSIHNKICL